MSKIGLLAASTTHPRPATFPIVLCLTDEAGRSRVYPLKSQTPRLARLCRGRGRVLKSERLSDQHAG
eukprot:768790-Hanusia_phi.AAC.9